MRAAGLMSTPNVAETRLCRLRREIALARLQEPMGQAISLQALEAFEIEQRLHHPEAGGIAIRDGHDVGAECLADRGIAENRLSERLPYQRSGKIAVVETRRDAVGDRTLKTVMVEDVRHQERRELRLAPHRFFRFLPDAREQRIVASEPDNSGGQTLRHDELPNSAAPEMRANSLAQTRGLR